MTFFLCKAPHDFIYCLITKKNIGYKKRNAFLEEEKNTRFVFFQLTGTTIISSGFISDWKQVRSRIGGVAFLRRKR
jgi:hypothetical protein